MIVKIASEKWLRKIAGIPPYVIDGMIFKYAGETIEVAEKPDGDWTEYTMDQIGALGISLPTYKNMLYEGKLGYTWSTLMFAETEEFNKRPPLNVDDILSFIDEGGK